MKNWSEQETADLKLLYNQLSNEQLIDHFGRSYLSIYKKARALGIYKTPEMEFINRSMARKREKCSNWKGGRKKTRQGYVLILKPEHHRADSNGYVMEHIAVWEEANQKELPEGYCVHHINGNKSDNRPENLIAMPHGEHTVMHHTGRKRSKNTGKKISKAIKQYYQTHGEEVHPSYKPIDPNLLIAERERGKTITQICKEVGITKNTYYKKLRRSGLL